MEPLIVALLVAAAGGAYLVYRRGARPAAPPPEDAWELPSAPGTPGPDLAAAPAREVFDRDALLNRRRDFDPSAWDAAEAAESAEAAEAAGGEPSRPAPPPARPAPSAAPAWDTADEPDAEEPGDLPRFFDRDYLERRARERGERP